MNRKAASIIIALVIVLLLAGVTAAQTVILPGSGWWFGTQIQNVGMAEATIRVTAYDSNNPATTYPSQQTVAPGGSHTFTPINAFPGLPADFTGSMTADADQPIRAIVNVTNRKTTSGTGIEGGLAAAQYQSADESDVATSVYFPIAKNNYYNKATTFFIQNAGTATAKAYATFIFSATAYHYTTPDIVPNQMVLFRATDAPGVPSGNIYGNGSLIVTSTQPLAGVYMEHFVTETVATLLQSTRGFASSDYATTVFAPNVKNTYYNRFTGLQVQNVSVSSIDITVTYQAMTNTATSCAGGTFVDIATNVGAGAAHAFVHLGAASNLSVGCLASATVNATGNIVAVVNESYTPAYLSTGKSQESTTYYSTIPGKKVTNKISLPLYKEDSYDKGTGIQIQNVGGVDAHVVLVFRGPTGSYTTTPQTILAGSGLNLVDVRNKLTSFWSGTPMTPTALGCIPLGCGANGVFGVILTSDQPIVAIANESTYPFTAPRIQQDKNNYEGFNLMP